jgi:hypothetical protein
MHDHPISILDGFDRRKLLKGSLISVGAIFLNNYSNASAAEIKLSGFDKFSEKVKVFKDSNYYLVESEGLPNHQMMVGINSWQQQVPTIQPYKSSNAWKIPISPRLSSKPISGQGHFLRGAIAVAVNGVPIFNALNNRGEDAYLAGELDDFGGHCGRADDYHYHVAPLHLQTVVGKGVPIAYALDGFPIYGELEPDGKTVTNLDEFNGHLDKKRKYHYHGTKNFPYINGGFRGVVSEIDGQVSPQPLTKAFRPAGQPLPGAKIKNFVQTGKNSFELEYQYQQAMFKISYSATLTEVEMNFKSPDGTTRTEIYRR